MASVLLGPDNEGEDKHVESELIPRLDESSNLSSSTFNTDFQLVVKITHYFTHINVKLCVIFFAPSYQHHEKPVGHREDSWEPQQRRETDEAYRNPPTHRYSIRTNDSQQKPADGCSPAQIRPAITETSTIVPASRETCWPSRRQLGASATQGNR